MFYYDALVMHKMFDLRLGYWGKRPVVTTWDNKYHFYVKKLLENGYKVGIVDQLESCENKEGDIIKRELTAIITQGTY